MHIVYACPEMIETPAIARVLHSVSFQQNLSGVYIDEAHVVLESISWRETYGRLYQLRQVLGPTIPFIALSATLPSRYRDALVLYTGLRPDYKLINLGNFRSELSTIIKPMDHSAGSFLDLRFVLGLAERGMSSIVYCDDLETLTKMFWWFFKQLAAARLPLTWLNIIHAGLSDTHQRNCIDAVDDGRVRILLGSDKIGAGMDFPSIEMVVQYQCRGLTLVRWEQRKGRGARRQGMTATGVILVEKTMLGSADAPTLKAPKSEDVGLLDLISTNRCLEACVDERLENPTRNDSPPCPRCSNCNPNLRLVTTHYTFLLESMHKTAPRGTLSDTSTTKILEDLFKWRQKEWDEGGWKEWPMYGLESLVMDSGLREIASRAHVITTIDQLDSTTSIPHLLELGPSLLKAIRDSLNDHKIPVHHPESSTPNVSSTQQPVPSTLTWQPNQTPSTIENVQLGRSF